MARSMNCVEKRNLLYSDKADPSDWIRAGESLLEQGLPTDALNFFVRADHEAGIERIRSLALDEGDVFLFEQLRLAGRDIPSATWREAAEKARALGKIEFAIRGLRAAGDDEAADALREQRVRESGAAPALPGTVPTGPPVDPDSAS